MIKRTTIAGAACTLALAAMACALVLALVSSGRPAAIGADASAPAVTLYPVHPGNHTWADEHHPVTDPEAGWIPPNITDDPPPENALHLEKASRNLEKGYHNTGAWEYCCHKDHHAQGILDPSKTYEIWFGVRFETATTEIREDMPSTFITVAGSTDVWCTHDVFKINDLAPGHNKICKYRVVPPRGLAESWVIAQSPNNDAYDYRGYWRAYGQIYEVKIGPQGGPYTYNFVGAPTGAVNPEYGYDVTGAWWACTKNFLQDMAHHMSAYEFCSGYRAAPWSKLHFHPCRGDACLVQPDVKKWVMAIQGVSNSNYYAGEYIVYRVMMGPYAPCEPHGPNGYQFMLDHQANFPSWVQSYRCAWAPIVEKTDCQLYCDHTGCNDGAWMQCLENELIEFQRGLQHQLQIWKDMADDLQRAFYSENPIIQGGFQLYDYASGFISDMVDWFPNAFSFLGF